MTEQAALAVETHYGRTLRVFRNRPGAIWDVVAATARERGEAEAVVGGSTRWTYRQLTQRAHDLAAHLAGHDIAAGDRVAILMPNRPNYVAALLAIWWIGAVAVPINVREGTTERAEALERSGARAVLGDAERRDGLIALDSDRIVVVAEAIERASAVPARREVGEDDPAAILYTSGTTGQPKGVVLTHFNIVHSCLHYREGLDLGVGESSCLAVPASHVTGLIAIIATMLATGGCILMLERFDADEFLALAAEQRMTHTLMVPAMYELCLRSPRLTESDLSAWRVAGFGGAPMAPATIESFAAVLPGLAFSNVYGSTESCSPATIMPAGATAARLASVGRPVACAQLRVVDADGADCAPGEVGEILIGGPQLSPGYWNDPAVTAREYHDGYWRSGDIGSIDPAGFVYLHDRTKDLINRGGYKVYSVEVEHALAAHPAVAEVAVVPWPCPVLGERIHAFVGLIEGVSLDLKAVRIWIGDRLADYKRPDYLTILNAPLPRNANGKVLKKQLRDIAPEAGQE